MRTNNLQYFPPRKNQSPGPVEVDTCQSNGMPAIFQALRRRAGMPDEDLSRMFLHRQAAVYQGLPIGSTPSAAAIIHVAQTIGVPPERLHPYGDGLNYSMPTQEAFAAAALAKCGEHFTHDLDHLNYGATFAAIRGYLEQGWLVGFGFKQRRWFSQLMGPEETHLQIAINALTTPGAMDHMNNHFVVGADFDDNLFGQGPAIGIANSVGNGINDREVQWVAPPFFKDVINVEVFKGFAGCNDRFAYDGEGIPGQVYRLYRAAYNRMPDKGGMGFQIDALAAGRGLQQLASDFLASPEGVATYPPATSDAQFVDRLYDNVLHRPGDAQGRDGHLADLARGTPRRDKLLHFSESPENKDACAPAFERGVGYI